jgi:hypothetical protein
MMNGRRWILIISSVLFGTFLAALLIQSRVGTLGAEAWRQLGVNFAFAIAIVVAIGIMLSRQRKKEEKNKNK